MLTIPRWASCIIMKLPEKIHGRNKIRDGAIVLYFKRDSWDFIQLCIKFRLTEMRIRQILAKNHAFIKRDKEWEKELRINRLKRRFTDTGRRSFLVIEQKDELAISAELRKEIEGENKIISTGDQKIIIVYPPSHKQEELNADRTERISSSLLT